MTPTVYMHRLGVFNYGGGFYHCVHMTQDDLDIVKEHNISVVTNPASNLSCKRNCTDRSYVKRRNQSGDRNRRTGK